MGRVDQVRLNEAAPSQSRPDVGQCLCGPGHERLRYLHELCLQLEPAAAGSTMMVPPQTLREWIDHPVPLDPPRPVGAEALQVFTVHQAKVFELPVVVLGTVCGCGGRTRPGGAAIDAEQAGR